MYVKVDGEETAIPISNEQPERLEKCPRFDSCCKGLNEVCNRYDGSNFVFLYFKLGDSIDMSPGMDIHLANASLMSFFVQFIPSCYKQEQTRPLAHTYMHDQTIKICNDYSEGHNDHDLLLVVHGYPLLDKNIFSKAVQDSSVFDKHFLLVCALSYEKSGDNHQDWINCTKNQKDNFHEPYKLICKPFNN